MLKNIFKEYDENCVKYAGKFLNFSDYFSINGKKGIETFIEIIKHLMSKFYFKEECK
jgi:hypothetical protein